MVTGLLHNTRSALSSWLQRLLRQPGRTKPLLLATLLYSMLVLIMSYPVAWEISSGIAGSPGDSYQHLWLLWWAKKAILDLHTSLADVSYLYFPQGAYHPILQVTPWIQLVALPLVLLFGPIVTYNVGFLLAHILSGVTLYLLAFEITEDHYAAFLSGLIFAFAPTRFIHGVGHYAQIMTYLFPLYFLCLIRLLKLPSLKYILLTTITLTASMLVNFVHVAYFIIPTTLILVAYYAWTQWSQLWELKRFLSLAMTVTFALLFTLPFFLPFLRAQSSGSLGYLRSPGVSEYGADLLAFFVPSPTHPLFDRLPDVRQAIVNITGKNFTEGVVYLGIIPLLLAVWGTVKFGRKARPWALAALITAVFSLGPLLKINGSYVTYSVDDKFSYLLMPYALLTKLPFYESARTPARMNATTMLALAILVGLGTSSIVKWLQTRRIQPYWLVIGLTPLILLEYVTLWPYPIAKEPIPEFYDQIAEDSGEFGVLDYPLYLLGYQSAHSLDFPMYYQLVHEHPIVGGYVWRMPPEAKGTIRALNNLVTIHPQPDIIPLPSQSNRTAVLDRLNIRYVVVHKQDTQVRRRPMSQDDLAEIEAHFTDMLGTSVYDDEYITAFRVPEKNQVEVDQTQEDQVRLVALGENWHDIIVEEDMMWRWTTNQLSKLYLYGESENRFHLTFEANSINGPRHVEILVNDSSIGTLVVHGRRLFITPAFPLPHEQNSIALKVIEACVPQYDLELVDQNDPCLNLRVGNVKLIPSETPWGQNRLDCEFGEQVRLLGYDLERASFEPGDNIELTLYWQAVENIEQSYTIFTHILDPENQIVAQKDSVPVFGQYPTDQWSIGEVVVDKRIIPLSERATLGSDYQLATGVYQLSSGQRLPISSRCPGAFPDQFIDLAAIKIRGAP